MREWRMEGEAFSLNGGHMAAPSNTAKRCASCYKVVS